MGTIVLCRQAILTHATLKLNKKNNTVHTKLPTGPLKHYQQKNRTEHQRKLLKIPTGRMQTSWLFTSATEKLNQGLLVAGSNSTSDHNGSLTRDLQISRQAS